MGFSLHPQLAKDCVLLGDLAVCRVLLMNNNQFPWLILVPKRDNAREVFDLSESDYQTVMAEVHHVASKFSHLTGAYKMNIAALGNMVPQLHIHIIARFEKDAAWPNPVWNSGVTPSPYPAEELNVFSGKIAGTIGLS